MTNPSEPFRERLLSSQPMTQQLRDDYRAELARLTSNKLTPVGRAINYGLLVVWLAAAGACVASAVAFHNAPTATFDYWINLTLYFLVFLFLAFGSFRTARRGEHTWREVFNVANLFYVASGMTITMALLRGLRAPHDPSSTFSAVYALTFLIVCLGWALYCRIDSAVLQTREHILRLESRLADLAEFLPKRA